MANWLHKHTYQQHTYCCCSVPKLCSTHCNRMENSTPGFPVLHYLLEFTQVHVHWDSDAIQPFHLLSLPSPPVLSLFQNQGLSNESVLHIRWTKYWTSNFSISPSNELVWFLCCPRDSWVISSTKIQKYQFLGARPSLWSNSHIHNWLFEKP